MAEYILLMHDDVAGVRDSAWEPYLKSLQESGSFEGGSAIGDGMCVRKHGTVPPITAQRLQSGTAARGQNDRAHPQFPASEHMG